MSLLIDGGCYLEALDLSCDLKNGEATRGGPSKETEGREHVGSTCQVHSLQPCIRFIKNNTNLNLMSNLSIPF